MTPFLTASICDFGLSRIADSQALKMSLSTPRTAGTTRWMAPELVHEHAKTTKESDIYAFACVCYEIFTGRVPFHEFTYDAGIVLKKVAGSHPSRPADLPKSPTINKVWTLMGECWDTDPSARPNASTILQHLKKPTPTSKSPKRELTSTISMKELMDRKVSILLKGGRRLSGVLRGYDLFSNLVLDRVDDETKPECPVPMGSIVVRAGGITSVLVAGLHYRLMR
ncbi:hypothetical protein PM082_016877 [Marasmius tenuissimus]|nr:hypothetical protein PM082_016877 [Marasmius tenuissimus]